MAKPLTSQEGVSLQHYIDQRLLDIEISRKAAYTSLDIRLKSMNEFRQALSDQSSKFITRDEHFALIKSIDADVRMLREAKANLEGKASATSVYIAYILSIIAIIIGIVMKLIK